MKISNQSKSIFDSISIDTDLLKIRSLSSTSWEKLAEGLLYEGSFHERMWGMKTREDIKRLYENAMKAAENQKGNPIVFLSPDQSEVYGMTNFMNVEPTNKMIEIGGTWIGKKWQKTFVNTRTKYELLRYAFEELNLNRVEFRIDFENYPSQRAVERLGIKFEGLHSRRKINANQDVRDYKFYSVTDLTWPSVKSHIEGLMNQRRDSLAAEIAKIKRLRKESNDEVAFEALKNLITQHPQHPGLQYLAASICDYSRTEQEAVPFYLKALERGLSGVDRRDAILGLASTYRSIGEYQKSKDFFEMGIEEFPNYRPFKVFLALTEYNLKNSSQAVSLLLKELVATTNDADIASYHRALNFYSDRLDEVFD